MLHGPLGGKKKPVRASQCSRYRQELKSAFGQIAPTLPAHLSIEPISIEDISSQRYPTTLKGLALNISEEGKQHMTIHTPPVQQGSDLKSAWSHMHLTRTILRYAYHRSVGPTLIRIPSQRARVDFGFMTRICNSNM